MALDVSFRFNIPAIKRETQRLSRALDRQLEHAMLLAGEKIAESARQTHPYQNRTGNLEASTQAIEPTGTFSEGTLEGGAHATMHYASYVDEMPDFAFMNPAYLFEREEVDEVFRHAIDQAIQVAGMGR